MGKIKENNIRDALKSIYDSYAEIDDFIFTTYNYEPDFFEEHIVCYLMGMDKKISTIGELNDADKWIRENHVSVYYDKGALSVGSSCLTVPVFPQDLGNFVFHPKVVVVYGKLKDKKKEAVHIIVSSCNLTVSGYGRNKEAFACLLVNTRKSAVGLKTFIQSLINNDDERHQGIIDFLEHSTFKHTGDVEFVWSRDGGGTNLLDVMKAYPEGDISIVSPYFDREGPLALLCELPNRKKTTIIPAIDGDTYNIHISKYENLKNFHGVNFKALHRDDENRFVHAKIIHFGKKLIVGSYNFTSAALKGKNAEAALIFDNMSNVGLDVISLEEDCLLPDNKLVSNKDSSQEDNCIYVVITVFWNEGIVKINAQHLKSGVEYGIRINGQSNDLLSIKNDDEKTQLEECVVLNYELTKILLKHKSFVVYSDGKRCFNGLINEFGTDESRPEYVCNTLNESIQEWYELGTKKRNVEKRLLIPIDGDDVEVEKLFGVYEGDESDIFDNYFFVARSFENLKEQIETYRESSKKTCPQSQRRTSNFLNRLTAWKNEKYKADQSLYNILTLKPGCIERILSLLQNESDEASNADVVYKWLVIQYVIMVLDKFPAYLKDNPLNDKYRPKLNSMKDKAEFLNKNIKMKVNNSYLGWIKQELFK